MCRTMIASVCAAVVLAAGMAKADLLAYEGFDMPAGDVVGQHGATSFGWSGDWTGESGKVTATASGFTYGTLATTPGAATLTSGTFDSSAYRVLANPVATGNIWISFIGQVAVPGIGSDFTGINLYDGAGERALIGEGWVGGDWEFASYSATRADSGVSSGTQSFVLVRLDVTSSDVNGTLYVNPTLGVAPTGGLDFTYGGGGTFDRIAIRGNNINSSYDEIRVGTSWSDVMPVPEPAAMAVLLISALGLGLRRRV